MTITDNPLDNDDRLRDLLSKIGDVRSRKAYGTWRMEFLDLYTESLDENGILNGMDANCRLLKQLERLEHRAELVVDGPLLRNNKKNEGGFSTTADGRRSHEFPSGWRGETAAVGLETRSFRNPLADAPPASSFSSPRKPRQASPVTTGSERPSHGAKADYRARYRRIAGKPGTDGWVQVSSRALQ